MKKKLFMLLLAAFLVLGVAACNGDETSTTEAPTTTAPETTTEDDTETSTTELAKEYPDGFYNFKFAADELRRTFFGAAERYLLETLAGGVPLFSNAGYVLYSNRLQLPVSEYDPVLGYGSRFGSMSDDDSTVQMADGDLGEAGVYTYRTTLTGNPVTLNHWLYDDSVTADLMDLYMDSLYVFEFNDDKTDFVVKPSMADSMPAPIDPETAENGSEISTVWQIDIADGLEWYFHPDTLEEQGVDPSTFTDLTIDANDFVDTYQHAIDNAWFRAISGGGDFFSAGNRIKNAEAYFIDSETTPWEDVGITALDSNTIEFEFVNDMSEWNVLYWLSSWVMTPINFELFDAFEANEGPNPYGTLDPTAIAYNGPYYIDYLEEDKLIRLKKNPEYHDPNKIFYDAYEIQIIEDAAIRFEEFEAGRLDAVGVPTEDYEDYKNHPGIKRVPGATTFRMTLNGFGTVENQQERFPNSSYVPEPILGNLNFRKALYFAIDRETLAYDVMKTSQPNMYLFSSAYVLNGETGVPFRDTTQGIEVGDGLSPETNAHNPDAATAYWELALAEEIAEGNYEEGTADTPTVIPLELHIFSGSEGQSLYGQYIETTFEELFQSDEYNVEIDVTVSPKKFPGIYYDYMMVGEFDMSTGGISGSSLDAASFLDVFSSDNRGGFTISFGVDTSEPDIFVEYTDSEGAERAEWWSFDAIYSALTGDVLIVDGKEADVPAAQMDLAAATPTTVEFTVDMFDSDLFENLTYTLQKYDSGLSAYFSVPDQIEVPVTSETMELTDLAPGRGTLAYDGDYQLVINYEYADSDLTGSTTTNWWQQPSVIDKDATEVTQASDSVTIDLAVREGDYARVIDSVTVLSEADYSTVDATVDTADRSAISISGLSAESSYYVMITFDDDSVDTLLVETSVAE